MAAPTQGEIREGLRRGVDQGDERRPLRSGVIVTHLSEMANERLAISAAARAFSLRFMGRIVTREQRVTAVLPETPEIDRQRRGVLDRRFRGDDNLTLSRTQPMSPPTIRPARPDEYHEIARVWMNSWVSTGLEDVSNFLLAKLRARIPLEIEKGWSLFVADDGGTLAAMLALHLPQHYLDQLFVCAGISGQESRAAPACFHAAAPAGRNRIALRARKRKSLALV